MAVFIFTLDSVLVNFAPKSLFHLHYLAVASFTFLDRRQWFLTVSTVIYPLSLNCFIVVPVADSLLGTALL